MSTYMLQISSKSLGLWSNGNDVDLDIVDLRQHFLKPEVATLEVEKICWSPGIAVIGRVLHYLAA